MRPRDTSPARRRLWSAMALTIAAATVLSTVDATTPAVVEAQTPPATGPATQGVGLIRNEPGAYQGYTLLSPLSSRTTFLIDMNGRVVHTWETDSTPSSIAYLLENGNLLRAGALTPSPFGQGVAGGGGRIQEIAWNGDLVWDFTYATANALPHHDFTRLPNGNILLIVTERKSADAAIAAGRFPESVQGGEVHSDALIEIRPTGRTTGEVVWEWHAWDHLIQDHDRTKANYGDVAAHPERIDVNFPIAPGRRAVADWTHFNAVAYNPRLDQVVVSLRTFGEFWVIDHSTTTREASGRSGGRSGKGGDLLYRWGNPRAYRTGTASDQRLFGQHNVHWIPDGYAGAGRLLVYNNGDTRPDGMYSSVEEVVPPMDASGRYAWTPGTSYGPDRAAWSYTAPNKADFYSVNISGATRLPNGNTLICAGAPGIVFEITPQNTVVWQYNLPAFAARGGGPGRGAAAAPGPGATAAPPPAGGGGANQPPGNAAGPGRAGAGRGRGGFAATAGRNVFRAYRYGTDFPGLRGRTLTPGRTIDEMIQQAAVREARDPAGARAE